MTIADIVILSLIIGSASYYIYRKFRKDIQKGKCASCPVYGECESEKKV
ncbi:hypothetical protein [Persephonella sp.]